jgi:sugar O-acyltransferase (sialic acid O-acetyltransferase NeuD family)
LVLVAGGGLAREAAESAAAQGHRVVGCLDDALGRGDEIAPGIPVLGTVDEVVSLGDVDLVVCSGKGLSRARLVERLRLLGVADRVYVTVVDPSARVANRCEVGSGSVLLAGTVLTADVTVGQHVVVMPNAVLTHDCVVEDFATICAGVVLGGGVRVGRSAYLGMACSVRENRSVGAEAVIGMGAVVLADVPGGQVWAGGPAAPITSTR